MVTEKGIIGSRHVAVPGKGAEERVGDTGRIGGTSISAEKRVVAAKCGGVAGVEAEKGVEGARNVRACISTEERIVASVGDLSTSPKTDEKIIVWARSCDQDPVAAEVVLRLRVEYAGRAGTVNIKIRQRLQYGLVLNGIPARASAADRRDGQRAARRVEGHIRSSGQRQVIC